MANAMYDSARVLCATTGLQFLTGDIKIVLVDLADYTFNSAHQFLSSIPGAARVATSGNLTNKAVTAGACSADPITLPAITGDSVEAWVMYRDTGNEATSPLLIYIDTGYTGFPYNPNGGALTINFPTGSDKIFRV